MINRMYFRVDLIGPVIENMQGRVFRTGIDAMLEPIYTVYPCIVEAMSEFYFRMLVVIGEE